MLQPGLDRHNFNTLAPGTTVGRIRPDAAMPLVVVDMSGEDVTERFFSVQGTTSGPRGTWADVVVADEFSPVMAVSAVEDVRKDCLLYVTRRREGVSALLSR